MANTNESMFHDTSAPYMLPHVETDHERLTLQYHGVNEMMHDKSHHAPLQSPSRILDVGCGTGIHTRSLARSYLQTKSVIGLDLCPVPTELDTPPQVSFLQGDIYSAAHPELSAGQFDYVCNRLLVYGINDWPAYISRAKSLLVPGGWLEIQEPEFTFFDDDDNVISTDWSWLRQQNAAWKQNGLDLHCGPKLEGYLRDAGFVDVQVKKFHWTWAPWPGHPETDKITSVSVKYTGPVSAIALKKILGATKDPQELDRLISEMLENLDGSVNGRYMPFWVVYGRKP